MYQMFLLLLYFIFSVNDDDLTPLDMAVMMNNQPMARTLLQHGGRENPKCK